MNRNQLVFLTICIFGLLLVFSVFNGDLEATDGTPPPLSKIFPDRDNGPHQEFKGESECLACHRNSIEIPEMGTTPIIPHEFRPACTNCHLLPEK